MEIMKQKINKWKLCSKTFLRNIIQLVLHVSSTTVGRQSQVHHTFNLVGTSSLGSLHLNMDWTCARNQFFLSSMFLTYFLPSHAYASIYRSETERQRFSHTRILWKLSYRFRYYRICFFCMCLFPHKSKAMHSYSLSIENLWRTGQRLWKSSNQVNACWTNYFE